MKFVKNVSLVLIYPMLMLMIGFWGGIKAVEFFYPGDTDNSQYSMIQDLTADSQEVSPVLSAGDTLSADTEYVLEETDVIRQTVVETVWKLPHKYIGMNREQFIKAIESYGAHPPLSELERGFVGLEVLSFSRERVVVQMNYEYLQPGEGFYLAVKNNEVVVLLENQDTVYIYTGILLEQLPEELQMKIMQMMWMEDEESLYGFLETYSS